MRVLALIADGLTNREIAERLVDESGALRLGNEALGAELRNGWLARVGAGEVLVDVPVDGPAGGGEARSQGTRDD